MTHERGQDAHAASHWIDRRRSGVLLHIPSLPGPGPKGVLGMEARRFIDSICSGGFSVWQFLPIGPTHGNASPYESISSFAGDPNLIDLQECVEQGWIAESELADAKRPGKLAAARKAAAERFRRNPHTRPELVEEMQRFRSVNAGWLDDFALFTALKRSRRGVPWWRWPRALRQREKEALDEARKTHADTIEEVVFEQFLFERQWQALKRYAETRHILLFGDLPIYAAHDSADVWSHQEYFTINEAGLCEEVAGVPPDYFSADGQRWGNPLYRWEQLERDGFDWWIKRIRAQLQRMHLLRIDHFRGLESYWAIPATRPDGRVGEWRKAPGEQLLQSLLDRFGRLPLVAEDLGFITPEVTALRKRFHLPGMKVLQFAFDGHADNPHLPGNFGPDNVVYLGTHDNDTTLGWFKKLDAATRARVQEYADLNAGDMPWPLIQLALQSVAKLTIITMQDLLSLDSHARLNTPGTIKGNWRWRLKENQAGPEIWARALDLNRLSGRC